MHRRLLAITALSCAALAGCALAPYGPSVDGGPGYTERQLDDGSYHLTFYGSAQSESGGFGPNSRKRQLRQNAHRRAEELCGHDLYQLDGFRQAKKPLRSERGLRYVPQITVRVSCNPRSD